MGVSHPLFFFSFSVNLFLLFSLSSFLLSFFLCISSFLHSSPLSPHPKLTDTNIMDLFQSVLANMNQHSSAVADNDEGTYNSLLLSHLPLVFFDRFNGYSCRKKSLLCTHQECVFLGFLLCLLFGSGGSMPVARDRNKGKRSGAFHGATTSRLSGRQRPCPALRHPFFSRQNTSSHFSPFLYPFDPFLLFASNPCALCIVLGPKLPVTEADNLFP